LYFQKPNKDVIKYDVAQISINFDVLEM